eukprot:2541847-Amphidinium_carterae.1
MKVYNVWRLVGPQLRERPKEQPRVKLPADPPVPPLAAPARFPDTDAPFQLGEHLRVVKHASFLQCLDCDRQAGKAKVTGKYTFAYNVTCVPRIADSSRPRSTRRDLLGSLLQLRKQARAAYPLLAKPQAVFFLWRAT